MNPVKAVAVVTFPIVLAGLIHLKLRKLFLQAALYRLAFLQGQAEVIEPRSLDHAFDNCNFPTLSTAIGPDQLDHDIHLQLCHPRLPHLKRAGYANFLTPTLFPLPREQAVADTADRRRDVYPETGAARRALHLREKPSVVVLDVSRPQSMIEATTKPCRKART